MFYSNELTHDPIDPINEAIPFLLLAKISQYTLWLKVHSHTTQLQSLPFRDKYVVTSDEDFLRWLDFIFD